jgi:hypothetical protein
MFQFVEASRFTTEHTAKYIQLVEGANNLNHIHQQWRIKMIELEKKETKKHTKTEVPLKQDKAALFAISHDRLMDYINGQEDPVITGSPDFLMQAPLALFPQETMIYLDDEWMRPNIIRLVDEGHAVVLVNSEISREKWMTKREYNARVFSLRGVFTGTKATEYGISEIDFRYGPQSSDMIYRIPVTGSTIGELLDCASKIVGSLKDLRYSTNRL